MRRSVRPCTGEPRSRCWKWIQITTNPLHSLQSHSPEVEYQPERDRYRERWEGFAVDGEQDQREGKTDQYGDEARDRRIPVSRRRGFADQHTATKSGQLRFSEEHQNAHL